jgi:REP element-mobilizing transposase RayT
VPSYSPTKIIRTIKSITARKILESNPEVKKELWGGNFWTDGYYVGTVGEHGNEEVIGEYIRNQGRDMKGYKNIHDEKQPELFEFM